MKILGFVNKFSRGVSKVQDELAANGNPKATFDLNHRTEFRVTVIESAVTPVEKASSSEKRRQSILQTVSRRPGIKREALFLETRIPLRSLDRMLSEMAKDGLVEYRGSRKTGGWFVQT